MAITKKDVEIIANLARLGLTDDEIGHFQGQLGAVLGYIEKLKDLDVTQVVPMAHALDMKNVARPDEVRPSLDAEKALGLAPARDGRFYEVPRVIE
jgi:aspartyl-tRNA(Asn)/glutamyl-tRNA(Gln) amidotransferase subunit C